MKNFKTKNIRGLSAMVVYLVLILMSVNLFSCGSDSSSNRVDDDDIVFSDLDETLEDWSEATHEKLDTDDIITNTSTIFDTARVQKMRIVIDSENWSFMNLNLADLTDELDGSLDFSSVDNPSFVPCEVFYSSDGTEDNLKEWYKVGVRFKGNSSLYNANSNKLPFKLDFDEFEDTYPEIDNQRFYGFKQLNLKSNYNDESEMREMVATELFRDFGLVGPHCSFYELYLNVDDSGDESNDIYYGVYTLVEEVDDTVIKTQYSNNDGTLYKPDGDAAAFASGTYDEDEYGLKTDDDTSYADIEELYDAINDSSRTSDNATWKANLEAIFDVDIFLKWLAANSVMQNWDTYGVMTHNFFLYNNPDTGKFEWIPWDNNEALDDNNRCLSMTMSSVGSDWPLIKYILDDDDYKTDYKAYIQSFADSLFYYDRMETIYDDYKDLITSYVTAEISGYTYTSSSEFTTAVSGLKSHVSSRNSSANDYASSSL